MMRPYVPLCHAVSSPFFDHDCARFPSDSPCRTSTKSTGPPLLILSFQISALLEHAFQTLPLLTVLFLLTNSAGELLKKSREDERLAARGGTNIPHPHSDTTPAITRRRYEEG